MTILKLVSLFKNERYIESIFCKNDKAEGGGGGKSTKQGLFLEALFEVEVILLERGSARLLR